MLGVSRSGVGGGVLRDRAGGYQPGVCMPLKALFLVDVIKCLYSSFLLASSSHYRGQC